MALVHQRVFPSVWVNLKPPHCQVKEDPAEFYATTGNHNEWDVDRMQEGNVRPSRHPRTDSGCWFPIISFQFFINHLG